MKRKLLVGGVLLSCLVLACWGMVQNSQEPVRYTQLPLLFLDGKLWKWTACSSPTYPVDVDLEDVDGFTEFYTYDSPTREKESTCLPVNTPYAYWSSEEYPEAVVAYVGKQRQYPGVDQWLGEWSIFVPYEESYGP